jgi:elongation factor P
MPVDTSDFKNGIKFMLDNQPVQLTYFQHVKPGKGGAFVRAKVKYLKNGRNVEKTFRAGEKFPDADIVMKKVQYLYNDGTDYVFMDNDSYDQLPFAPDVVGDAAKFLLENMEVSVMFFEGKPLNIDLPTHVILEVTETEPGMKGDTSSNTLKPATVETGAQINVQLFINVGDKIRVDTRTGEYVERVKQ